MSRRAKPTEYAVRSASAMTIGRMSLAGRSSNEITDALNRVLVDLGGSIDPFAARAARRILENSAW